jgi:hypothetical protein
MWPLYILFYPIWIMINSFIRDFRDLALCDLNVQWFTPCISCINKKNNYGHNSSYFTLYFALSTTSIFLVFLSGSLLFLYLPAYGQDSPGRENEQQGLEPPGNVSDSTTNEKDVVLNTTSSNIPVLEKLSDKGSYKIQLRWGQPPSLLPENGFDMEIVFLNATAPTASPETFPQKETNETGFATLGATGITQPSTIERMVPIKSYDISIYSEDGKEIWKKSNQAVQAGRAYERVTFEKPYTGNITVSIYNIKSSGGIAGTIAAPLSETTSNTTSTNVASKGEDADKSEPTDSVKFPATVVATNP